MNRCLQAATATAFSRHVELRIEIIHRADYSAPLDECEVRCKDEIVKSLEALGVRKEQG